ncbi:MAG: hypothetical protein MZV65_22225 [Chromatiales bacterium]|nr:hypothetical protein [Chromatiales bacterium]
MPPSTALQVANLHDFVAGLHRWLRYADRERCAPPSRRTTPAASSASPGPQWDPKVLVFDEATGALDNVTERVVMEAIHK